MTVRSDPSEAKILGCLASLSLQGVLIQNGVYRSDSLEADVLSHRIEGVARTHVFVEFASGAFLFGFREIITTRLAIVRPTQGCGPAGRLRYALDGQAAGPHPWLSVDAPFRG